MLAHRSVLARSRQRDNGKGEEDCNSGEESMGGSHDCEAASTRYTPIEVYHQ